VRGDRRIPGVVVLLLGWMAAVLAFPLGRTLFEITALPVWQYLAIFALAVVWSMLCRLVWRWRLLDGWLGTAEDPGNLCAKAVAPKPV
jgi:dolichyl-phosphate-mannose--protein O-mannosyl transferase